MSAATAAPAPTTSSSAPSPAAAAVIAAVAKGADAPAELLNSLTALCIQTGASDIHLSPDWPPCLRLHGYLDPVAGCQPLSGAAMEALSRFLLNDTQRGILSAKGNVDGSRTTAEGVRFRFNVYLRGARPAVALRRLEDRFRSLGELGLPEELYELSDLHDGLVVVAGPTGAGKSTTLATLLDRVNRTRRCHIVTIEDPVEYVHKPIKALINQRELHTDTPSFNDALVASLRQDPDVILVGEIREITTIRTAITAAETGHLVFATVHAGDCVGVVERLVGVFPADEQDGIRRQLSLVLRAVITQHLLPGLTPQGKTGRVVTSEILRVTPAVANLIAKAQSSMIYSSMESGRQLGMQTLEQDLARLWVSGRITEQTAVGACRNVNVLRDRAAMLRKK
jgi:twitching motility protein PilT